MKLELYSFQLMKCWKIWLQYDRNGIPKWEYTYGLVEDNIKKDEYGRIGFGPESISSSVSSCAAALAAASAARSKANSAAFIGSLKIHKSLSYFIISQISKHNGILIRLSEISYISSSSIFSSSAWGFWSFLSKFSAASLCRSLRNSD